MDLFIKYEINILYILNFFQNLYFQMRHIENEVIISKKIFFHKFLIDEKLILPTKDLNVLWYSEKKIDCLK